MAVYDVQFYQKQLIEQVYQVYPSLANNFFDASVNCGRCGATKILQRIINGYNIEHGLITVIDEDGYIGNDTLRALGGLVRFVGDDEMENDWRHALSLHYKGLIDRNPKLIKYLKGWHNRLMEVY